MSLSRPAFHIQVKNLTRGWVYEATQGDEADPAAPVVLLDDASHSWNFVDDRVPGPFDPATLSFRLAALSVSDLPPLQIGDVIEAHACRPLVGWPADPDAVTYYWRLEGRLSEPELELDPHARRSATARLVVVDFLADLNQRTPNIDENTGSLPFAAHRLITLSALADLNIVMPDWWAVNEDYDNAWVGIEQAVGVGAHELMQLIANTSPVEYSPGERVVCYPRPRWLLLPVDPVTEEHWFGISPDGEFPPVPGVWFWITPILRRLGSEASVLRLVWSGGMLTAETHPDADERDGLCYLDASRVRTPLNARKAREQMVDTIVVEAFRSTGDGTVVDAITRSTSRRADTEFGTVTRTVPTHAMISTPIGDHSYMVPRIAAAFMPDGSADDQPWGFDQLNVCTWLMDDDELDRHAAAFWPAYPTLDNPTPRTLQQLVVHGASADVHLEQRFMTAIVTGATHTIQDGRMLIQPQLIGGVLPPNPDSSDAVSAADLTAAGVPWSTYTAAQLDPTLTADEFRLIGAP